MNIEIAEHAMTKKDYFKIIVSHYFRRRWWLYGVVFGMFFYSIYLIFYGDNNQALSSMRIWVPLFLLSLPLYYVYNFYRFSHHILDEKHFRSKSILLTDKKVEVTHYSEGQPEKPEAIEWEKIYAYRSEKNYLFIYVSSLQFLAIPKSLFQNMDQYDTLIKFFAKSKKKKL